MFIVDVVVGAFVVNAAAVVFLVAVLALRHKDYPDGLTDDLDECRDGIDSRKRDRGRC